MVLGAIAGWESGRGRGLARTIGASGRGLNDDAEDAKEEEETLSIVVRLSLQ